jgi:hypothetical protein
LTDNLHCKEKVQAHQGAHDNWGGAVNGSADDAAGDEAEQESGDCNSVGFL